MKVICLHLHDTTWGRQGHSSICWKQGDWTACTALRILPLPLMGNKPPLCLSCPSQVPEEMSRCRNSYTEQELKPLTLEALGRLCNDESASYQHFLQDCVDSLFKEVKEKFKGWVSYSTSEQAELSYKKVCRLPVVGHLNSSGQDLGSSETRYPFANTVLHGDLSPIPFLIELGSQVIHIPRVRVETSSVRNSAHWTCVRGIKISNEILWFHRNTLEFPGMFY